MYDEHEIAYMVSAFADQIAEKTAPEIAEVTSRAACIVSDASKSALTKNGDSLTGRENALVQMIGGLLCVLSEKKLISSNELDLIFAQAAGIGSIDEAFGLRHAGRDSDYPWSLPRGSSFDDAIKAFKLKYKIS